MKQKRVMSLKTQTTVPEYEQPDSATRTSKHLGELKRWNEEPGKMCRRVETGLVNANFDLLGEVFIEVKDVATDDNCEIDECETGLWEGWGVVDEREGFKREVDERGNRICFNIETDADRAKREEIVKRGKMGVGVETKTLFGSDEAAKDDVFAVTTGRDAARRRREKNRKTEERCGRGRRWNCRGGCCWGGRLC